MDDPRRYMVQRIGLVRSNLRAPADAPNQAFEGAPNALLEIDPTFTDALHRIGPGDELIVLTRPAESDRRPSSPRHRTREPDEAPSRSAGGDRRHADHRPQDRDGRST